MAEALEAAVGVDRELAVEVEGAGQHLLPGRAPRREAEVLHEHELGRGEAVVHLGQGQLVARVGDARLAVGVLGGAGALGEPGVVVAGVAEPRTAPGDEGQGLQVERAGRCNGAASSARTTMAAAAPSATPAQS